MTSKVFQERSLIGKPSTPKCVTSKGRSPQLNRSFAGSVPKGNAHLAGSVPEFTHPALRVCPQNFHLFARSVHLRPLRVLYSGVFPVYLHSPLRRFPCCREQLFQDFLLSLWRQAREHRGRYYVLASPVQVPQLYKVCFCVCHFSSFWHCHQLVARPFPRWSHYLPLRKILVGVLHLISDTSRNPSPNIDPISCSKVMTSPSI